MAAPSLQPDAMGHWWVSHGPEDDEPTCRGCGQSMTLGSRVDPPCPRLEPCPRPYTPPACGVCGELVTVGTHPGCYTINQPV